MQIYFAPLEGVTDVIYRRVHHECFSGVDKYFIPFISPTQHLTFTSREQRAVSPEENAGISVVPQILTKNPEHFVWMAKSLGDAGYEEINLNLGCPSGTVTAKGKGSGMLRDPEALERFLDAVFAQSPIAVSIKTRIGFESMDEWPRLLEIFAKYPVRELIVHPRTRREYYAGRAHRELCSPVLERTDLPLVYNGDLNTAEDCRSLMEMYPGAKAIMLGRGLVANPALAQEVRGGERVTLEMLRGFHNRLYQSYVERWPEKAVIGHMHEIMSYVMHCFEDPAKPRKAMRKATKPDAYLEAVNWLFDAFPLKRNPGFMTEEE